MFAKTLHLSRGAAQTAPLSYDAFVADHMTFLLSYSCKAGFTYFPSTADSSSALTAWCQLKRHRRRWRMGGIWEVLET
jgi:hypothetical protein